MEWESASATDAGRIRKNNEDALLVHADPICFAVADGMGGHAAGEVASRLAIETLTGRLAEGGPVHTDDLVRVFEDANRAILEHATANPATRGMGTTLTVLAADAEEGQVLVAHIGDSRLYRWRGDRLEQLSRDHTWVQEHIDAGILTADQARNHPFSSVLTRVLGTSASAIPEIERVATEPGDLFLLCSDGLSGMLEDEELAETLEGDTSLTDMADALVALANEAGGADNITLILARVIEPR